jgi:hypothetical protein
MLQEFIYIQKERKRAMKTGTDEDGEDYEWVELPSFDDPTKTKIISKLIYSHKVNFLSYSPSLLYHSIFYNGWF